jgi:hypothetical protein
MRAWAARVRMQSRSNAPAVGQSADQDYGKRVSARQASGRGFMGVNDGWQRSRGRPEERRDVMRPPRSDVEVALEGARSHPNGASLPSRAALACVFPAVHSTLPGKRSRSTTGVSFASGYRSLTSSPWAYRQSFALHVAAMALYLSSCPAAAYSTASRIHDSIVDIPS